MIQRVLLHYRLPALTCIGLLLFMSVFIGVLAWVFRKGSQEVYAGLEQFPLQELNSNPDFKGDSAHV